MHFLAHLYFAKQDTEYELGQIAGDFVRLNQRESLSPKMQLAHQLHQCIDAFTDRHSEVKACKVLLSGPYRRYAGLSLDLLFDHLLACHFERLTGLDFMHSVNGIEARLRDSKALWPEACRGFIGYVLRTRMLSRLIEPCSIELNMARIVSRLSRPVNTEALVAQLHQQKALIEPHFLHFFPQLCHETQRQWQHLAPTH